MESGEFGNWKTGRYLELYVNEPLVAKNSFRTRESSTEPILSFDASRPLLPQPHWPANRIAIDAYWKAWELAWANLHPPHPGSGFVSPYIDTAFNDCLFMWDSVAILRFGRYGHRAFPFQGTLDNLYAKQHQDGYICREIRVADGTDQWHRETPFGTGPNILAWSEWSSYEQTGDLERLAAVYPVLTAYHRWTRKNRSWPDGSYWTNGLGSGMDNMARVPAGCHSGQEHGWMTWTDATFLAILSARLLARMSEELGVPDFIRAQEEATLLADWANEHLWDDDAAFYFDRDRHGNLMGIKSVAGYWALLAGIVPPEKVGRFVAHLDDPESFNRHHRVPSLAANEAGYSPTGDYWNGAVWTPTNYAILSGLTLAGQDDLAFDIARNHHQRVLEVFKETGTFWENYAPETSSPGLPAKADFVGWSGLPPIAVLLEYVFGLRPTNPLSGKLVWDVRLLDEFGVDNYPLGPSGTLQLRCACRPDEAVEPQITIRANVPVEIEVRWKGGAKTFTSPPSFPKPSK